MSNLFDRTSNTAAADLSAAFTVGLNNFEKASEFRKVTISDLAAWVGANGPVAAVIGTPADGATLGRVRFVDAIGGEVSSVPGGERGQASIDFQIGRTGASEIASGFLSVLLGGFGNTASGTGAVAIGGESNKSSGDAATAIGGGSNLVTGKGATAISCTSTTVSGEGAAAVGSQASEASGKYSVIVGGIKVKAERYGESASGSFVFSGQGDAQRIVLNAGAETANATPTPLFLDGPGASERMDVPVGSALAFTAKVFGISTGGTVAGFYIRQGIIRNTAGTTALIGSIQSVGTDIETDVGLNVTITADNTNDALDISVTGIAATDMRWLAVVECNQIGFA